MSRAPFQVLVLPYFRSMSGKVLYSIFRRTTRSGGYWQGIAGGGEDDETPLAAARRETAEEAGIPSTQQFVKLHAMCMIPVVNVCGFVWGPDVLVIPEYAFAVQADRQELHLSDEHAEYRWVEYDEALRSFHWDSNKSALWELNYCLTTRRNAL